MLGAWPAATSAVGGVHWVSAGACGGDMRMAEMFCARGCSAVDRDITQAGGRRSLRWDGQRRAGRPAD